MLPVFGWGVLVYMGYAGHGLAWQNRRFEDADEFRRVMRLWNIAGVPGALLFVAVNVFAAYVRYMER